MEYIHSTTSFFIEYIHLFISFFLVLGIIYLVYVVVYQYYDKRRMELISKNSERYINGLKAELKKINDSLNVK